MMSELYGGIIFLFHNASMCIPTDSIHYKNIEKNLTTCYDLFGGCVLLRAAVLSEKLRRGTKHLL